jgi:hypothetical protein
VTDNWFATDFIKVIGGSTYIRSVNGVAVGNLYYEYDSNKNFIGQFLGGTGNPFTVSNSASYITFSINSNSSPINSYMLNTGSTALPYEPYGYKIPIVCGSVTTPVYIGNEPLRMSSDETTFDEVNNTGVVIHRVDSEGNILETPTTTSITAPEIPTVNGSQTFDVDTTVPPSSVYIRYY